MPAIIAIIIVGLMFTLPAVLLDPSPRASENWEAIVYPILIFIVVAAIGMAH